MRPKSLALLLLALGCGLVASIGITEVIARRNAEPLSMMGETQPIFVAQNDIALGEVLTSQLLKLEQWPRDKIPNGAISKIEDIEGRRSRTKLYAGEPILENRLLGKGASEQGATALIPKGYRVVPVKVDLVSGGGSMILPGDRVDVLVHVVRDPSREISETVTRTILQDIKVFAVDDVVDLEKDKGPSKTIAAKTISLLVTPEQAVKVMLATQMGIINLVMRSPEDDQQTANIQARPGELLGAAAKGERSKESLLSEPVAEKNQSFLDFLNSTKAKAAAEAIPETKARETWTMRLLKPGDVAEVQFEEDGGKGSPFGAWKMTTSTGGAAGGLPAPKAEPKFVAPPAPGVPGPDAGESSKSQEKKNNNAK
jgi:pilus assembly protein CpaB